MGFNYFTSVDPDKPPLESKVHFTYINHSESNVTISDYHEMLANGTTGPELEASFWAFYKDILSTIAFNHFVSVMACLILIGFSMLWISLTTRQLLWFYLYIGTLTCLPMSYLVNNFTVEAVRNRSPSLHQDEPGFFWIYNFFSKDFIYTFIKSLLRPRRTLLYEAKLP